MVHTTTFPVRYAETDQMGVVHHSVYAIWFECGRTEFIKEFDCTYAGLEQEGCLLPLLQLHCEFKRPLRYGDTVHVKTWLMHAGKTRMRFGYSVHDTPEGLPCGIGMTEHAWTDKQLRPVNLSRHHPDLFAKLGDMFRSATGD